EEIDAVVIPGGRVVVVHRSDGDDGGVVTRRADAAIDLASQAVLTEVASGNHDRDAGSDRAPDRDTQRIGRPLIGRVRGQAHVHDADVVFARVIDDPLDAFQRIAQRTGSLGAEDLDVVDAGVRGDAGRVARVGVVLGATCCDRCDVRPVTVTV